ncbi:MAG: hypothetical protein GTO16_05955 [Candidatus Aminicenantes bacterium]|nr:hypothetical protein [Candidatus Aminicenantes bacterium]
MTLVSVFLFFIFSALGLSMLYFSQIYLKLSTYKKNSTLLDYASENGIKLGLDHLLNLLSQTVSPSLLSQQGSNELREDTVNKGYEIVEKLLGARLPLNNSQSWESVGWQSSTNFYFERIEEKEDYFHAFYKAEISSEGRIKNFKEARESSLEARLGVLAGNLPLSYIPLLIDKKLDAGQKNNFTKNNKIDFLPSEKNLISPQISFAEGDLIPKDANSQVQKALKIKFFYPQNLSNRRLRTILGLEETNEPVPDGVYLIKDDLGLGGIYVQGDLEEMVTAIEEDFQVVAFLTEQGCWILKFSPQKSKTIFSTPVEVLHYDLIPLGIIIVNGKINSLGGGVMDPSGQAFLVTEEEIPSIINGVNLTIISSDKITISSHLIHQGVKWIDKVPYVKDRNSQLNIFVTGNDFLENTKREGKIIVDKDSPQEIKIQASLTAADKGFSVEGKGKTVHILGSLHASDYSSNGNKLNLAFDERLLEESDLIQNAPKTAKPVLCLSFFKPMEWKEF